MIYLDYAASTPLDPRVLEAMLPYFSEQFGNPSSIHRYGQRADAAVENARRTIAGLLSCAADEIIFTSGGTESDNLALRGTALAERTRRGANHILVSAVEHHAVRHTAEQLASLFGFDLEFIPTGSNGMVTPDEVNRRLRRETAIVSIIHGNNEIGTINPVQEIGAVCHEHGVLFHTDAVQSAAHFPMNLQTMNVDLLSIGAHKFYGPKGTGVLFIRKGTPIIPTQTGGAQEFNLRAGTSNVPYLVGMAEALSLVSAQQDNNEHHLSVLRDKIIRTLLETIPDCRLTGHPQERLPNHCSFAFRGLESNNLLMILDSMGFACASGSACKTGTPGASEILQALGFDPTWSKGALRVTIGRPTGEDDINQFLEAIPLAVSKARKLSVD